MKTKMKDKRLTKAQLKHSKYLVVFNWETIIHKAEDM